MGCCHGEVPADERTEVYTFAQHGDFVFQHSDMKLFSSRYELKHEVIGSGAFAKVKQARVKASGEQRAVKIIDKLSLSENASTLMKTQI